MILWYNIIDDRSSGLGKIIVLVQFKETYSEYQTASASHVNVWLLSPMAKHYQLD